MQFSFWPADGPRDSSFVGRLHAWQQLAKTPAALGAVSKLQGTTNLTQAIKLKARFYSASNTDASRSIDSLGFPLLYIHF